MMLFQQHSQPLAVVSSVAPDHVSPSMYRSYNNSPILAIWSLLIVLSLWLGDLQAAPEPVNVLSLQIVPHHRAADGKQQIMLGSVSSHFHVVLTNISAAPIKLWKDSCSWGYANLWFESVDQAGKIVQIKKRPKGWNKNFPEWVTLAPGAHWVLEVKLDDNTWQNWPLARPAKTINPTAVFESARSEQAQAHGVWGGEVRSAQGEYMVFYVVR